MGAWVWASGNQVWKGNIGTLMPKPMNMPPKIQSAALVEMPAAAIGSRRMSKVWAKPPPGTGTLSERKYSAMKLMIMSAEPNSV